jgi:Domain of unknown function (DUF1906)
MIVKRVRLARLITCLCSVLAAVPMMIALSSAPAGAATKIGNRSYHRLMGFDSCFHPSAAGLEDWLKHTPWYVYGTYLGGSGGAYVGCTPVSKSTLDSAIGRGWAVVPFWYGRQMPEACGQAFFPDTISLNTSTAYSQGVQQANDAKRAAEAEGYGGLDAIWYDLESYGVSGGGCIQAAEAFMRGWDHQMDDNTPYLPAMYGSTCGSFLSDFASLNPRPAIAAAADPNDNAGIYNLVCLPNKDWDDYNRIHQFTGPIENLTYNGYTIPAIDEDCVNSTVDANSPAGASDKCKYIG